MLITAIKAAPAGHRMGLAMCNAGINSKSMMLDIEQQAETGFSTNYDWALS